MHTKLSISRAGRSIVLLDETARLLERLKPAGVRPILVKGISLLLTVYKDDVSARPMDDVDLFIMPEDFAKTKRALVTAGFARMQSGEPHYARNREGERHGMVFDLHTSLPYLTPGAFRRLWKRARRANVNGEEALILDERDELAYLVYHASVQHGDMHPIWTGDLDLVIRRLNGKDDFDWKSVALEIRRRGFGMPAAVFFERLVQARGTPVQAGFIRACHPSGPDTFDAKLYRYLTRGHGVFGLGHVLRLFTIRGINRVFYVFRYAFMPPEFIRARYASTGTLDTVLALIFRPVRGLIKLAALAGRVIGDSESA